MMHLWMACMPVWPHAVMQGSEARRCTVSLRQESPPMPVFAGIMHKDKEPPPAAPPSSGERPVESTKRELEWSLPLGASAGQSWESIPESWTWDTKTPPRRPGLDAVDVPTHWRPDVPPEGNGYPSMPEGKGYPGIRYRDPLDPVDRTWDVSDWQRTGTAPPARNRTVQRGVYGEVVEPSGKGGDRWTHDIFMTRSSIASTASRVSHPGSHQGLSEKRLKVPVEPLLYGNSRDSNHTSLRDDISFSPYTQSGASDTTIVLGPPGSASPDPSRKEELTFVPATEDRVSPHALEEMQYITDRGGENTVWMRVVHSGYGQDTWRTSLRTCGLTCVFAQSPSEGAYVHLPAGWTRQQLINTMNDINLDVRRRVRFRDMNRSNKSRLQFKQDLLTISYPPWPNGRPSPVTRVAEQLPTGPPRGPRTAADEWSLFMQQMPTATE